MATHVYTGPTLSSGEVAERYPAMHLHPPVKHGDLFALDVAPGDVVVLIDGLYHQRAPVRHKEILHLVDRGVHVVGCSSMGALRGAELADCGMVGNGTVFSMYRDGLIDADDEVAVTHGSDDFHTRNVPLVNIRHAVGEMVRAGALTADEGDLVVAEAQRLHYSERSWRMLAHRLGGRTDAVARAQQFLADHPQHADVKRADAWATLADLDALVAHAPRGELDPEWRNPHVFDWLPEFSGDGDEPDRISDADVVRYQQLHDPDFPQRWRAFVVSEVRGADSVRSLGATSSGADVARAAFAAAAALDAVDSLENPYLSAQEQAELDADERVVRTLVRSYVPPRGLSDMLEAFARPDNVDEVRARIRHARQVNDNAVWQGKVRLVERLATERLQEHVAALWQVEATEETLARAARERGWIDLADAVATARAYFLSHTEQGGRAAARWETR